jgi:dihydropteroate synthase
MSDAPRTDIRPEGPQTMRPFPFWQLKDGKRLPLDRPLVMGILNVTPDSFSDGGRFLAAKAAIAHASRLIEEGADIIDIGGESTRPGAEDVPQEEELARVLPVIEGLAAIGIPLSIDTRRAAVMRAAARAGASILNDVTGFTFEPESLAAAAETGAGIVIMHSRGDPRTMQQDPRYDDVTAEIAQFLAARVEAAEKAGIPREKIVVDPGIGFGKTAAHNLTLLKNLSAFSSLGVPLLIGVSRKRFLGTLTGVTDPDQRLPASLSAALWSLSQGAKILRVHDVAATRQALTIWEAIASAVE